MNALLIRTAAAQATVNRFNGKPLAFSTNDCGRMAAFNLRRLGYKPPMPKAGSYRSMLGARKALKALGFADLSEALDALGLPRTSLAYALPADVIGVPGEGGLTALWIALGNGRALGWHADSATACIVQPRITPGQPEPIVWRADPRHG